MKLLEILKELTPKVKQKLEFLPYQAQLTPYEKIRNIKYILLKVVNDEGETGYAFFEVNPSRKHITWTGGWTDEKGEHKNHWNVRDGFDIEVLKKFLNAAGTEYKVSSKNKIFIPYKRESYYNGVPGPKIT